jgi:magnesium transporter
LHREVIEFGRATGPLRPALRELTMPGIPNIDPQLIPYFRDVADHAAHIGDQVEGFGTLLAGALQATLTQVSVRQNEDMRRISAWVAIIAVPTAVAGIYGMNFEYMPELEWHYGYPGVLLLILAACTGLYVRFRRSGWL